MSPIPSSVKTKIEEIKIGSLNLKILTLLDRCQFSDDDGSAERSGISSASWPLFGMIWPSTYLLAERVGLADFSGKRVLEIGCGLAIAGLVAHTKEWDITVSDFHPLAGEFLLENLKLNSLPPLKFELIDWTKKHPTLGKFDIILGSDILYERGHPDILQQFILEHLEVGGQVVIVDPGRGNQKAFQNDMGKCGFVCQEEFVKLVHGTKGADRGRVMTFQRPR